MEYDILQQKRPNGHKKALTANIIESFALASSNPAFSTMEFHDALKDFRKYGCRTPNAIEFDLDRELIWIARRLLQKTTTTVEAELLLL